MAVAFDFASAINGGGLGASSATTSHTISGTNRVLLVGVSWSGTGTTMSVTYGGVAADGSFTQADASSAYHTKIFYWIAPAVGTANIVCTPSSGAAMYGGAASFTGVHQTNPFPQSNQNNGVSAGAVSVSLTTTVANSWLFSAIGMTNFTSTLTPTETQVANEGNNLAARRGAASRTNTGVAVGSNSMTWTISGATGRGWGMSVVSIAPAGTDLTLSSTSTTTASRTLAVGKPSSVTSTTTTTFARQITAARLFALTSTTTTTLTKAITAARTFLYMATGTASRVNQVGKLLSSTVTGTVTRINSVGKVLSVTSNTLTSIQKALTKTAIAVTSASTATLTKSLTAARTFAYTATTSANTLLQFSTTVLNRITGGGTTVIKKIITLIIDD